MLWALPILGLALLIWAGRRRAAVSDSGVRRQGDFHHDLRGAGVKSKWDLLWVLPFLGLGLLIWAGQVFEWGHWTHNAGWLMIALPYLYLTWLQTDRTLIFSLAFILALGVGMFFWLLAWSDAERLPSLVLLPLPVAAFFGALWAPAALRIFIKAKQEKNSKVAGPGWQAFAMFILFLPAIILAISMPKVLGLDTYWLAVSLTLVGVLISAVISEPLRRFMLEWAGLEPDPNPH